MNDIKSNAATGNDLETIIGDLQRAADAIAAKCPEASEAALALITAVNYGDETLVDSSLASLKSALAGVANDCIARELEASKGTQAGLRDGWQKYIDKQAYDLVGFEGVKDKIESLIHRRIDGMEKVRKLVRGLEEFDQPVERSSALDDGIRQLRTFRDEFLKGWPASRPPSPIDREAVSKAREAIRGGAKGMSKGQLIWGHERSERAG